MPTVEKTARVLLIEDDAPFRAAMRRLIEDDPDFVVRGEAATASDGLRLALEGDWDVVILDLDLPDGNGLDLLGTCAARKPQLPVLVVTMHSERALGPRTLRAGAAGFLHKSVAGAELLPELRRIAAGKRHVE